MATTERERRARRGSDFVYRTSELRYTAGEEGLGDAQTVRMEHDMLCCFVQNLKTMGSSDEDRTRLDSLLEELHVRRRKNGTDCCQSYERQIEACQRKAAMVLLLHGTQFDAALKILGSGELLSRAELGKGSPQAQIYLELQDWVFTSAGVLYPDRPAAFIFGPEVEVGQPVEASPWDSGALVNSLCNQLPAAPNPQRREVFRRHAIPSPLWREYMAHYVASCFASMEDYLEGRMHSWSDPQGALGRDRFSRVFEVRFHRKLRISGATLKAVFIPLQGGERKLIRLRSKLVPLEGQVYVDYYEGSGEILRKRVRAWMKQSAGLLDKEEANARAS